MGITMIPEHLWDVVVGDKLAGAEGDDEEEVEEEEEVGPLTEDYYALASTCKLFRRVVHRVADAHLLPISVHRMDALAAVGELGALKFFHGPGSWRSTCGCSGQAVRLAVCKGQLAVLEWLHDEEPSGAWNAYLRAACEAEGGAQQGLLLGSGFSGVREAMEHGHVPVLDYLLGAVGPETMSPWVTANGAVRAALRNGQVHALRWLEERLPATLCFLSDGAVFGPRFIGDAFASGRRCGDEAALWLARLCGSGSGDTLRTHMGQFGEQAAAAGSVTVLEWLLHRSPDRTAASRMVSSPAVARAAAGAGHVGVLEWLLSAAAPDAPLPWLTRPDDVLRAAASHGHVPVLEWMVLRRLVSVRQAVHAVDVGAAVAAGHSRLLQWTCEHDRAYATTRGAIISARAIHEAVQDAVHHRVSLATLEWVYEHRRRDWCFTAFTLTGAAGSKSSPAVAHFLLDRPSERTPIQAMAASEEAVVAAALAGNLSVLERLLAVGFPRSPRILDAAARTGNLDILQWMHATYPEVSCPPTAVEEAARNGHLSVLKWLHDHHPGAACGEAMDAAAVDGHLDVLRFLHKNRPDAGACTMSGWKTAAALGHVDVLRWMAAAYPSMLPAAAPHFRLGPVVMVGNMRDVKWVCEHLRRAVAEDQFMQRLSDAVGAAAVYGQLMVAKYLVEGLGARVSPDAARLARRYGYHRVEAWLRQQLPSASANGSNGADAGGDAEISDTEEGGWT